MFRAAASSSLPPGSIGQGQLLELISVLLPTISWGRLDTPLSVEFERNDNNVWLKSVPALTELQGDRLRGRLRHFESQAEGEVELVPLRGGAAGWRPRLIAGETKKLWPPGEYGAHYELRVEQRAAANLPDD